MGPLTPNIAIATVGFVTDSTADLDVPPYDAVIVVGIVPPTTRVEIMKVTLVDPLDPNTGPRDPNSEADDPHSPFPPEE